MLFRSNAASPGLTIGDWSSGNSFNWPGPIDDVRIYNRALSAQEIKELYNATAGSKVSTTQKGIDKGLIGHWTFDGRDMISNVADASGQGNDAYFTHLAATTTVIGKIGQALYFNGGSWARRNDFDQATFSNKVSVSLWIKNDSSGVAQKYFSTQSTATADGFAIYNNPTTYNAIVKEDGGWASCFYNAGASERASDFGVWTHVAMEIGRAHV